MRKILTTITGLAFALVIFASPISYRDWKNDGNTFADGFEGFVSYFSWLTPENQARYIEQGEFDRFGKNLDEGQSSTKEWRKVFREEWANSRLNGQRYSYYVQ